MRISETLDHQEGLELRLEDVVNDDGESSDDVEGDHVLAHRPATNLQPQPSTFLPHASLISYHRTTTTSRNQLVASPWL